MAVMKRIKKHFLDMFIPINKQDWQSKSKKNAEKIQEIMVIIGIAVLCIYCKIKLISILFCALGMLWMLFIDQRMRHQEGSYCVITGKNIVHLPFFGIVKVLKSNSVLDIGYTNCLINLYQGENKYKHVVKEYIYISTIPVDLKILANLFIRHWKNRHIIIVPATEHNIEVLTKEYGFKINKKYRNKLTYENYGNYIYGKKQFEEIKKRPF